MVMKKDLTDIGDSDYKQRAGEFMFCLECGAEWGGTRGDFWDFADDYVFVCDCGSKNFQLTRKEIYYIPVK